MRRSRQSLLAFTLVKIPGRKVIGGTEGKIEQADVHVLAPTAGPYSGESGEHGISQSQPRHEVNHRQPEACRGRPWFTGQREETGLGLHQIIITRPVGTRPCATVGTQVRTDDLRVPALEVCVGQTEFFRHISAQVRTHGIGRLDQLVEHRPGLRPTEIQRKAFLVTVQRMVEKAVMWIEKMRPNTARHITTIVRVLDLDHLCAEISQKHRPERASAILFNGNDSDRCQRQHQRISNELTVIP